LSEERGNIFGAYPTLQLTHSCTPGWYNQRWLPSPRANQTYKSPSAWTPLGGTGVPDIEVGSAEAWKEADWEGAQYSSSYQQNLNTGARALARTSHQWHVSRPLRHVLYFHLDTRPVRCGGTLSSLTPHCGAELVVDTLQLGGDVRIHRNRRRTEVRSCLVRHIMKPLGLSTYR
jgi:hypothetical protein